MSILAQLAEISVIPVTDVLGWVVIAGFLAGTVASRLGRPTLGRQVFVGSWVGFALFWFLLIQHFTFVHRSIVQAVLTVIAVPTCLYVGYALRGEERETLVLLSRAVGFMGLAYLPFTTSAVAQALLIETVARQTTATMEVLGLADGMQLVQDPADGSTLVNTFWFPETGQSSKLVIECTGIEAMAIFAGLVGAVRAPLRKKTVALVVAISIIWVSNIARNTFIALANGYQWFAHPALEGPVMFMFGLSDPTRVSFFVADRIISQGLALFVLVGIAFLISRWLPQLLVIGEELLYLLTGEEVNLRKTKVTDGGAERD